MKKLIFVMLSFLVVLLSCSKGKVETVCYYCTFSLQANGTPPPPRTVCIEEWEDINNIQFTDDKGNRLASYCTK